MIGDLHCVFAHDYTECETSKLYVQQLLHKMWFPCAQAGKSTSAWFTVILLNTCSSWSRDFFFSERSHLRFSAITNSNGQRRPWIMSLLKPVSLWTRPSSTAVVIRVSDLHLNVLTCSTAHTCHYGIWGVLLIQCPNKGTMSNRTYWPTQSDILHLYYTASKSYRSPKPLEIQ